MVAFFFFQAEDGIRDAQESRGLGDVYKRQGILLQMGPATAVGTEISGGKEVFIAALAVGSREIISLRNAPPKSGGLCGHFYLVNICLLYTSPSPRDS